MHLIQITDTKSQLKLSDNGGTPTDCLTTDNDFVGLFRLRNSTSIPFDVAVSDTDEDICLPDPLTLASVSEPGSTFYLPVGAASTTTYTFTPTTGGGSAMTLTIPGYVGRPQIKEDGSSWGSCRHNGSVIVRNQASKGTVSFDTDPPGNQLNPGDNPLSIPAGGANTLTATVGTDSYTIDLVDQASPTLALSLDSSGNLISTTRVIALDSSQSSMTMTIVNATNSANNNNANTTTTTSPDGVDVEVEFTAFDNSSIAPVTIPKPGAGLPATLGTITIDANTAWLNIGVPSSDGTTIMTEADSPTPAPDSPTSGTDLTDDPIVVVKHTGRGGAD